MPQHDKSVLIRYAGGSGGETLGAVLGDNLDISPRSFGHDTRNTMRYIDIFRRMFLAANPTIDESKRYSVPFEHWMQMQQDDVAAFVAHMRTIHPERKVGMMHYIMPPNLDYQQVFPGMFIVDMFRMPHNFWTLRALHFYKVALIREYAMPETPRMSLENHRMISEHHAKHGWYPRWWGWFVNKPIGALADFLEGGYHAYDVQGDHVPWTKSSDLFLDGAVIATDLTLNGYTDLFRRLGIETMRDIDRDRLSEWVSGNIAILEKLQVSQLLGFAMTRDQQMQLLKDTFIPRYEQLLEASA